VKGAAPGVLRDAAPPRAQRSFSGLVLGTALVEDTAQQISNCPWVQGSVGRHHRPTSFLPWGCFNGTGPFFSIPIAAHVQCNGCWQTASVSAFHCLGCGYTDYLRSACWMVLHSQSCVQLCDICFFSPPPPRLLWPLSVIILVPSGWMECHSFAYCCKWMMRRTIRISKEWCGGSGPRVGVEMELKVLLSSFRR
jgi:hypothetical protein